MAIPRVRYSTETVWTIERVQQLGVVTDIETAGAVLGLGRTTTYRLAKDNQFPAPVIRAGRSYRVPVAGLLRQLLAEETE